jgi:hypothetical protein
LIALTRVRKAYRPPLATPDPLFKNCISPVSFLYPPHFLSLILTIFSVVLLVGYYPVLLLGL